MESRSWRCRARADCRGGAIELKINAIWATRSRVNEINQTMSESQESFIVYIQRTIEWLDERALQLSKEDMHDSMRVRMVELAQRFVAFPHCENFALMQEEN